jgi:hypothetical protein
MSPHPGAIASAPDGAQRDIESIDNEKARPSGRAFDVSLSTQR